jgi:hypothetical protein
MVERLMSVSFHRKRKISDDRITINSGFDWTFMTLYSIGEYQQLEKALEGVENHETRASFL